MGKLLTICALATALTFSSCSNSTDPNNGAYDKYKQSLTEKPVKEIILSKEEQEKISKTNDALLQIKYLNNLDNRVISMNGNYVKYDEQGRVISMNGNYVKYDEQGRVISMNGNYVKYDEQGRVISMNGNYVKYESK